MWTNDQAEAISNTGGTLLVSAAAGSGKTAVLVERIIQKIIKKRISIDKFLVVTFTNKAAQEMREKIEIAISKEIYKHPKNAFLANQLILVHKAQITTVHSFCFNLIRENFSFLNLENDFKIANDIDIAVLKKECMRKILNEKFEKIEKNSDFKLLVDIIGEHLIDGEMINIYDFLQSHAEPRKYLEQNLENYKIAKEQGFDKTFWYTVIIDEISKVLDESIKKLQIALKLCDKCKVLRAKNYEILQNDLDNINSIKKTISDLNLTLSKIRNIEFKTWKTVKDSEDELAVSTAKNLRDGVKKAIKEKTIISQTSSQISEDCHKIYRAMSMINEIIFEFDDLFTEVKRKKNIVDFSDAEHLALKLVTETVDGNLQKSALGYDISAKFSEIMVDEYQDTNEIQDILFRALSNDEKNIFMVGDVKQSIYKFRLADPMIFLEKYLNFKDFDKVSGDQSRKIVLSKNFRSRKEVLDSTNYIFENIMTKTTGQIDYDDKQKLYLGADYPLNDRCSSEFMLIDYDKICNGTDKNPNELEAEVIAKRIKNMLDSGYEVYDKELKINRKMTLNDVVILLRTTSTKAYFYKSELEKMGFSVDFKEGTEKLFGTPEIRNLISIFEVLNNYRNDIHMLGILRSPIFSFDDNHIASLRNREQSFYESIVEASENGDIKCQKFLEDLEDINEFSQNNTIFSTFWYILDKMNVLATYLLMDNGSKRYSNILRFADFLQNLDESYSIYDFVQFLEAIDNKKVKLPAGISSSENVRIMTIHASKGLEFPVVFLADTAKEFNKMDLKSVITMHNNLGIAIKCIDDENIVRYPSIMQKAIKFSLESELLAEEMRILYVAMTRAKEKLIICATIKKAEKNFENWINFDLNERNILSINSYQMFFGPSIVKLPSSKLLYEKFNVHDSVKIDHDLPNYFECVYIDSLKFALQRTIKTDKIDDIAYQEFSYNYANETKIPSKLTATAVKEQKISLDFDVKVKENTRKPMFLSEKTLTGAERGIAHHKVMQFIDFSKCGTVHEISEQIEILYQKQIITKAQKDCINPMKIYGFTTSEIYNRIKNSKKVMREFQFSLLTKASEYYKIDSDDEVLMMGVVDCLFFEDDEIIMIDYKTDYVNAQNIAEISQNYSYQLDVYANALSKIFNKPVKEKLIYYFSNESFYKV